MCRSFLNNQPTLTLQLHTPHLPKLLLLHVECWDVSTCLLLCRPQLILLGLLGLTSRLDAVQAGVEHSDVRADGLAGGLGLINLGRYLGRGQQQRQQQRKGKVEHSNVKADGLAGGLGLVSLGGHLVRGRRQQHQ